MHKRFFAGGGNVQIIVKKSMSGGNKFGVFKKFYNRRFLIQISIPFKQRGFAIVKNIFAGKKIDAFLPNFKRQLGIFFIQNYSSSFVNNDP